MKRHAWTALVAAAGLILGSSVEARYGDSAKDSGAGSGGPSIKAHLVDAKKNAAKATATVVVTAENIRLIDPSLAGKSEEGAEGHLHYQVDNGFVVATPGTKLSFHELSPGEHRISVTLADDHHNPIGSPVLLIVDVPKAAAH